MPLVAANNAVSGVPQIPQKGRKQQLSQQHQHPSKSKPIILQKPNNRQNRQSVDAERSDNGRRSNQHHQQSQNSGDMVTAVKEQYPTGGENPQESMMNVVDSTMSNLNLEDNNNATSSEIIMSSSSNVLTTMIAESNTSSINYMQQQ